MLKGKIQLNPTRNHGLHDDSIYSHGDWSAEKMAKDLLPEGASDEFKRAVASTTIFWAKNGLGDSGGERSVAAALVKLCMEPTPVTEIPTWEQMENDNRATFTEPTVQALLQKCIQKIKVGIRSGKPIEVQIELDTPSYVYEEVMKRLKDQVRCSVKHVPGPTDPRGEREPDRLHIGPPEQKKTTPAPARRKSEDWHDSMDDWSGARVSTTGPDGTWRGHTT